MWLPLKTYNFPYSIAICAKLRSCHTDHLKLTLTGLLASYILYIAQIKIELHNA